MANANGWDLRPNGDIAVQPVMGWSTAAMPLAGLLRLEYATSIEAIDGRTPSAMQFAMSGPQVRELGEALLRMADAIDAQPKGTRQ